MQVSAVSGCLRFTFKICQIYASTSMIRQFHDFFLNLVFGGFLTFGPTVRHDDGTTADLCTHKLIHGDVELCAMALKEL